MTESIQIQLKKGALELCVLALLAHRESYAYEIASTLAAGAVVSALTASSTLEGAT